MLPTNLFGKPGRKSLGIRTQEFGAFLCGALVYRLSRWIVGIGKSPGSEKCIVAFIKSKDFVGKDCGAAHNQHKQTAGEPIQSAGMPYSLDSGGSSRPAYHLRRTWPGWFIQK